MVFSNARERMSSFTHLWGAIGAGIITIVYVIAGVVKGSTRIDFVSAIVFSVSMVLLYTASTVYHYVKAKPAIIRRLRKLDHSMIYVLIAGSYTPFSLHYIPGKEGIWFIAIIWAIALAGITLKMFFINSPSWLSALLYLLMGWAIVFKAGSFAAMETGCFVLLLLGGLSYTFGAVIYALKKPNWFKEFGFHEIFHLFILAGSAFHAAAVLVFIL